MVGHHSLLLRTLELTTRGILAAAKASPCRALKGKVLDTLLGSEDTYDYVSRTN
jgi:hypothetical protein